MKKTTIVYNGSYDTFKKAIEYMTKTIAEFTDTYCACTSKSAFKRIDAMRYVFLDITPDILTQKEEYLIKVVNDDIYISGSDNGGLLYGVIDFYNKYIVPNRLTHKNSYYYKNIFEDTLPEFELRSSPSVSNRGIWTWGHVIFDYRSFIDNMTLCKMNTLIVWDDYLPVNAKEMIAYAHENNIKVIWGFSWLWDTGFSTVTRDVIDAGLETIVKKYKDEYSTLGGDGIYFQSFTELKTDMLNGMLVADAVTEFVNNTAKKIFEITPDLELQFGLHATSVKEKTEYIAKVDPRIRIVWEDCGAFPFNYSPKKIEDYQETAAFTKKICTLRGNADKFGVVLKGCTNLNWREFEHQYGEFYLGSSNKHTRLARADKKRSIWRYVQAYWLSNADKAYDTVKIMSKEKSGDLYVTALVEDGLFEQKVYYPVALLSEMLWDAACNLKDLQTAVALRDYVEFV